MLILATAEVKDRQGVTIKRICDSCGPPSSTYHYDETAAHEFQSMNTVMDSKSRHLSITRIAERVVILSSSHALAPANTLVFTAAAADDGMPGPLSYSLSSNCAGMFAINGATGAVRLAAANSPFGGSCDVTVTVSDGALQTSASTTVVLQPEVSDEIFVDDFEL